jgi:glycosyltransferase involved in cell wall biosynthesis
LGEEKKESERKIFFKKENNTIYLLCLTRYYPHKNVEILLKLGELLKKNKAPYKIITTIDSMQTLQAKTFVENIKILNLSDIIINLGTVPVNDVRSLYGQVDALLLPTLLESFSATYADSLFLKKPIFTSDRDFAKDVCADCAYYFDPMSAASIYNAIEDAYKNRNLMEIKLNKGFERVNNFPDWNKVADLYIEQLRKL